jgi:hydrogenase nickel incorporation protein HypB
MCAACGCGASAHGADHRHGHSHGHGHDHAHARGHGHEEPHERRDATALRLEQRVLARNDAQAERNRRWFAAHRVVALNLLSSPGAGKTAVLERTLRELGGSTAVAVLEGDQEGELDAVRIREAGGRVVQLHTGQGCHLDARLVQRGLEQLIPAPRSLLLIENVGNLVCPALFDVGERAKVVVASVAEGDDKPLKYPHAFRAAELVLLNKLDLLPYVPFETPRFADHVRRVNPQASVLPISALRGDGLRAWYDWLRERVAHVHE